MGGGCGWDGFGGWGWEDFGGMDGGGVFLDWCIVFLAGWYLGYYELFLVMFGEDMV